MKQILFIELRFIENSQQIWITWFSEKSCHGKIVSNYLELPYNTSFEQVFKMIKNPSKVYIKEVDLSNSLSTSIRSDISQKIFLAYPHAKILIGDIFDHKLCLQKEVSEQSNFDFRMKTTS